MAASPEEEPAYEVVVLAQRLATAKAHVHQAMRDQGYRKVLTLGHRSWYSTGRVWKAWVMVHDEGFARVRGGMLASPLPPTSTAPSMLDGLGRPVNAAFEERVAQAWPDGEPRPRYVFLNFLTQSPRQARAQKEAVAERLEPALAEVREARWQIARNDRSAEQLERLRRVWQDGIGPDGEVLASADERRASIVEQWLDTEPDEAGAWMRSVIERYVVEVVQTSPEPFTAAEIALANARRSGSDPFDPAAR